MKRKFALILASAMMLSMLVAGCGSKPAEPPDSSAAPAEGRTFTVGFDASFPPYGYLENGEYIGFDLDLAQEVCNRNGWELVKAPIEWDAKDSELKSGAIDCIWNGFTINGREDAYTWTEPYVDNTQVFVVKADSGITTPQDLAGKVVMVQQDSSALAALTDEENPDAAALTASFDELIESPNYETALLELTNGSADAVAMDVGVAVAKQAQNPDLVILDEIISTEQYGIGFKLGNEELRDAVWATLLEMEADGTVDEIAAKYSIDTANICIPE